MAKKKNKVNSKTPKVSDKADKKKKKSKKSNSKKCESTPKIQTTKNFQQTIPQKISESEKQIKIKKKNEFLVEIPKSKKSVESLKKKKSKKNVDKNVEKQKEKIKTASKSFQKHKKLSRRKFRSKTSSTIKKNKKLREPKKKSSSIKRIDSTKNKSDNSGKSVNKSTNKVKNDSSKSTKLSENVTKKKSTKKIKVLSDIQLQFPKVKIQMLDKNPDILQNVSEFDYIPSAPMQKIADPAQKPSKNTAKMAQKNPKTLKTLQSFQESLKKVQVNSSKNQKREAPLKAKIVDGSSKSAEKVQNNGPRPSQKNLKKLENNRSNNLNVETSPTPRIVDGLSKRKKVPETQKIAEEQKNGEKREKPKSRRQIEIAKTQKPFSPRISTQTTMTPTKTRIKTIKTSESSTSEKPLEKTKHHCTRPTSKKQESEMSDQKKKKETITPEDEKARKFIRRPIPTLKVNVNELLRIGSVLERYGIDEQRRKAFEWIALNQNAVNHNNTEFAYNLMVTIGDLPVEQKLAENTFQCLIQNGALSNAEFFAHFSELVSNTADFQLTVAQLAHLMSIYGMRYQL